MKDLGIYFASEYGRITRMEFYSTTIEQNQLKGSYHYWSALKRVFIIINVVDIKI